MERRGGGDAKVESPGVLVGGSEGVDLKSLAKVTEGDGGASARDFNLLMESATEEVSSVKASRESRRRFRMWLNGLEGSGGRLTDGEFTPSEGAGPGGAGVSGGVGRGSSAGSTSALLFVTTDPGGET